jgi:hypothetical protein
MTYPTLIKKYESEEILQEVNFVSLIGEENINSVEIKVEDDKTGLDVTDLALSESPEITIDGTIVSFFIKETIPSGRYIIEVLAITDTIRRAINLRLWVDNVFSL